jgi:hypothetical protein
MAPQRLADGLAGFRVPQTRGPVVGRCDNAASLLVEDRGSHKAFMALYEFADRFALGIPKPRTVIPRGGKDVPIVRTEDCTGHDIVMAGKRLADGLAGFDIPKARSLVPRGREDVAPAGVEDSA